MYWQNCEHSPAKWNIRKLIWWIIGIAFTKTVFVNNTLLGVIAVDLFFDDYVKLINDISVFNEGYAFLLNENGNYLVHKEHSSEENITNVIQGIDVTSENKGISYYNDGEKNELIKYYCTLL